MHQGDKCLRVAGRRVCHVCDSEMKTLVAHRGR